MKTLICDENKITFIRPASALYNTSKLFVLHEDAFGSVDLNILTVKEAKQRYAYFGQDNGIEDIYNEMCGEKYY